MEFLNPNVFYMMLVPLILLFVLLVTSKSGMQRNFSKEILDKLRVGKQYLGKNTRNTLYFLVLILFIITLARPVINQKEQNIQQNLIPIVIALDVSTSMRAADIYPNRISLAKKKLQHIIQKAQNTTIGVVLFAKDSFVLSPVTEDFLSLKFIVDNLDTNLDFINGSNVFSTLEATKFMLEEYKVKNLIILSDGGNNNEYTKELEFVKENDIVVYSIGLATKEGAPIPKGDGYLTNDNGDIVTVKLNESIKNLSLKSAGGYIDYTLDDTDVQAIINRINIQSKKEELTVQKIKTYTELFYYPLSFALFLLLLALSSFPSKKAKKSVNNSIVILSLLIGSIFTTKSEAYTFDFEKINKANDAYEKKDYKTAEDNYRSIQKNNQSLYNLANTLYKEKKYTEAIDLYTKIITDDKELESKKLHNLGNSYVNTNNLKKAKELYEKSLKIKKDKETQENLDIVNKELEKQENKKDKKKQQDKNKDDNKKKNDKNKKEKDQKNQKKNSEKNSQKDQNKEKKENEKSEQEKKQQEQKKNNKSKEDKKNKDKSDKEKDAKSQKQGQMKKDQISDMEEKKWMKMLQKQKTPIYLQKVKTEKESNYDEKQPW